MDVGAVFEQDPPCIRTSQGHVVAVHSGFKDEQIKGTFRNTTKDLAQKLLNRHRGDGASKTSVADCLAPPPTLPTALIGSIKARGTLTFNTPGGSR